MSKQKKHTGSGNTELEKKLQMHIGDNAQRLAEWEELNNLSADELSEKLVEAMLDEYHSKGREPSMTIKVLVAIQLNK